MRPVLSDYFCFVSERVLLTSYICWPWSWDPPASFSWLPHPFTGVYHHTQLNRSWFAKLVNLKLYIIVLFPDSESGKAWDNLFPLSLNYQFYISASFSIEFYSSWIPMFSLKFCIIIYCIICFSGALHPSWSVCLSSLWSLLVTLIVCYNYSSINIIYMCLLFSLSQSYKY